MSGLALGDQEVQDAIRHFITEAKACAKTQRPDVPETRARAVLGFAAMSTVLAVILAVGESLLGKRASDKDLIARFCEEMGVTTSWLIPPAAGGSGPSDCTGILTEVRNGLVHALSMPPGIVLVPDLKSTLSAKVAQFWKLAVPEFVDAVEETVARLSKNSPSLPWAPGAPMGKGRGPVGVVPLPRQGANDWPSSGGSLLRKGG